MDSARLSIIVPYLGDASAFESTLVSVLQRRPEHTEIIVSHRGDYSDPFNLGDEVRFATDAGGDFVDLIQCAAKLARGKFVHILADGITATDGWTDAALEKFEHFDCGSVATVVRDADSGDIVSVGWTDDRDRLAASVGDGLPNAQQIQTKSIGAWINGSFWRCDLLRSLGQAYQHEGSLDAAVGYHHLARQGGWRNVLASHCNLIGSVDRSPADHPSFLRGQTLQALHACFGTGGWGKSISNAALSIVLNLSRPWHLLESLGRAFGPLAESRLRDRIDGDAVLTIDAMESIVLFPEETSAPVPLRRAA